jgi:hypothetical protein
MRANTLLPILHRIRPRPFLARHPKADQSLSGLSRQRVPVAAVAIDEGAAREVFDALGRATGET